MKRIFLAFAIFITLFSVVLISPEESVAQGSTNTFNCSFEPGFGCVVGSNNCSGGFKPNDSACSSKTDFSACQGVINQPCIEVKANQKYSCYTSFGGCQADPNGAYTDFNACQSACKGATPTKFSCKNNQCVEAQNGTYTNLGDCASACSKNNKGNSSSDVMCGADGNGIDTAIGCIPVLGSQEEFLGFVLKWAVGVGGGVAFLLILYAGFMIMSAAGNPERLKAGQELMTSAISGLVLLIFSIFVLKFIGIDILGLCKFGFGPAC